MVLVLYMEELRSTFQVDVTTAEPDVHPQLFCNGCYAAVKRHSTAVSKGRPYHYSVEVFTWEGHTEECVVRTIHTQETYISYRHNNNIIMHLLSVMEHLNFITRGGGHNKRAKKNRGRPSGFSPAAAIAHIKQLVKNHPR